MAKGVSDIDLVCLEQARIGVCVQDDNKNIVWSNQTLADLFGVNKQTLANDADILATLMQDNLPLYTRSENGEDCWLERQSLSCDDGRTILIFQDVTQEQILGNQNSRLNRQVKDLKLTDDLTGLANQRAITQALEQQITRSRRYQNPLCVVMVYLETSSTIRDEAADKVTLAVSRFLRDRLRWVDQIGRWNDNVFLMVLPETQKEDAQGLIDKIIAEKRSIQTPTDTQETQTQLSFGLACWQKGDDMRTLLKQVLEDLKQD